jgi:hypothetical protein
MSGYFHGAIEEGATKRELNGNIVYFLSRRDMLQ